MSAHDTDHHTGHPIEAAFVPLAAARRSGRDESVHHGAVVALEADGSVAFALGDPDVIIYPRSSLKPLQATAMVAAGLDLPPELLALVCASHDGLPEHIDGARRILASVGLDEDALATTPDYPLNDAEAERVIRAGGQRRPIQMNCSGKHAGMLATSVVNGWPHDASYLDPAHPLQQQILNALPDLTGVPVEHVGVDGCGAPTHMFGLVALARAYARIATGAAGEAGLTVHRAMTTHPEMVGGPARDVTLLMRAVPGLMVKDGAQGVYAAGLPDGRAVALKVADGGDRPRAIVMAAALAALGVDLSALDPAAYTVEIRGHGRRVGEVHVLGDLARHLPEPR